jgi:transposase
MHVHIYNQPPVEMIMNTQSTHSFTAFVGIDWADKKHDFCLQAAGEGQREFGTFAHTPEAIALWAKTLHYRFDGPIAICLELSKGAMVCALQRCPFLEIFPVHPSTLAKYREAFVPSHAKDDPTDAEMALEILLRHPDKLDPIQLQSEPMRLLSRLVEDRRSLVNDVIGITNRLTNALK